MIRRGGPDGQCAVASALAAELKLRCFTESQTLSYKVPRRTALDLSRRPAEHAPMRSYLHVLVVATLAGAAASLAAQAPPAATLVLVNGRIHTVDAANATVEAVAIAGDRIVAAGTTARMRALAGPAPGWSISAGGR